MQRVTSRSRLFLEQATAAGRVPDAAQPTGWADRARGDGGRLGRAESGRLGRGGGSGRLGEDLAARGRAASDARPRGGSLKELRHLFANPELYGCGTAADDTQMLLLRGGGR